MMKNEPLVTVVIPIYNTERYLERCVESVLNQTYRSLEILLVDDGSPDGCPRMCDAFAERDARVRVIHKQNEGLGMARNTGIDHATGDYICFFDSDDYVEPDTVAACVAAAVAHRADMVVFGHTDVTPDGTPVRMRIPHPPKPLFVGAEITAELLPASLYTNQNPAKDWELALSSCNKLFSMAVIRRSGWRFVSEREIIAEDYYSLTELHGHLDRVYILDRAFYHYTVNTASLSRSFRSDRFERIKGFSAAMITLADGMGLRASLEQPIRALAFGFTVSAMKQIVAAAVPLKQRYEALKQIVCDDTLRQWVCTADRAGVGMQKKLLYTAVKHQWARLCFLLVYLKNRGGAQ